MPGEVQPAVDQVEGELRGEVGSAGSGLAGGGVDGDADLAGEAGGPVAFECDYVGGRGVLEKLPVEPGEVGVGEEDDGEFAGGEQGPG